MGRRPLNRPIGETGKKLAFTLNPTLWKRIEYVMQREGYETIGEIFPVLWNAAKGPLGYDRILGEYEDLIPSHEEGLVHVAIVGAIAAGKPIESIEENTETVAVPKSQLSMPGEYFALRVKGDSMRDDHINDGDIVICHHQADAEKGDRIVAMIEEKFGQTATLKRYFPEGKRVALQSSNGNYAPIYVSAEKLKIGGKVVAIIPKA